jgi:hypothetical protein
MTDPKPKSTRGFASLTPERRKEIASQGGRAAHASGNAHKYTSDEARAASSLRRDRQAKA